jgi:hypothetical protein
MKFGKNLGVQQAKYEGFLRFLNYKDLKKMIKLNPNDPQFEVMLQAEIEAVNESFSEHVDSIQARLLGVASQSVDTSSVSSRLREIMHIADEVEVLRRFAVWNAVGVVKILKKRTKALAGPSPPGLGGTSSSSDFPPPSCPTETWLSKQLFFSGSAFAELQASLDSLADELTKERLGELAGRLPPQLETNTGGVQGTDRCPICLELCVDAVELSTCGHRICWKCCVLGPIAFAPGEYRLSRCSVCRNEQPLDPTKNFKTVCSNKLRVLSELVHDHEAAADVSYDSSYLQDSGLDILYGTAGGAKNKVESEKERQTMESIDACPVTAFFCSLCCEPLLLEAVSTTPCKHFFHRYCLEKYAERTCPLCDEPLPIQLVTPRYVQDRLRRLAETTPAWIPKESVCHHECKYSDSACSHCREYSYQNLPPVRLLGYGGCQITSYLHVARPREAAAPGPESAPVYYSRIGPIRGFSKDQIEAKRKKDK